MASEVHAFDINGRRLGRWRANQQVVQLVLVRDGRSLLACGDRGVINCIDTATYALSAMPLLPLV